MKTKLELVTVRHDSFKGWVVKCSICGPLLELRNYWPAFRAAAEHEAIHQPEKT